MVTSPFGRKVTIFGALVAFMVLGVTIGLITQRDSGTGSAAIQSGVTSADVRYIG